MKLWKEIKLVKTCDACPEQYDVYLDGEIVGYLRMRHGFFRVTYGGKKVYETGDVIGEGCFDYSERDTQLKKAKKAIAKAIIKETFTETDIDKETALTRLALLVDSHIAYIQPQEDAMTFIRENVRELKPIIGDLVKIEERKDA